MKPRTNPHRNYFTKKYHSKRAREAAKELLPKTAEIRRYKLRKQNGFREDD